MIYEIIKFMAFCGSCALTATNPAVTDLYMQNAPSAFIIYEH